MKKILDNKYTIILLIFILEIIFLMYSFPVLHDDLLHGSIPLGLNFMPHVNGRYLGNFFGLALAANLVIRVVIKSLVIILMIVLTKKILNIKNNLYLLIFLSLFLFIPKEMFRETMPFSAGFANYTMPIIGILFVIHIHFNKTYKNNNYLVNIFFLVIGIFNSLFVEHITIYNLLLSIYFIVYDYVKTKKINHINIFYFMGSLVGTMLMFINPTYLVTLNGEDTYRSFSTLTDIIKKPWAILRAAFFHNYFVNFLLVTISYILYKRSIEDKKIMAKSSFIFITLFFLYSCIKFIFPDLSILVSYTKHFEALITFCFFISIGYIIYISKILNKHDKYRMVFYIISMIMILAPLVVVSPLGPRCYLITYILMIILVVDLFMIIEKKCIFNINNTKLMIIIVLLIQMLFYLYIYGNIYLKNIERLDLIESQISENSNVIEILNLPHQDYLHIPTICSEYGELVFKEYYKLPVDIILKTDC